MYYDYFIVLDKEIGFLWKRAGSASAYWFFAVRYSGFAGNLPVTVFTFYTLAPKWCRIYHTGHQVVLIGTQLIVLIVMTLRIHALYGRNLRLLAALLAVALPLLVVVLWSTQGQKVTPIDGFPGCHVSVSQSTSNHIVASWEALFIFDTLMFLLVVRKTYTTWHGSGFDGHLPIHALILRDGALYFATIAAANFCNILTFYFAGPILAGSLSTFASCISVTMMARLMLNLHEKTKGGVLTDLRFSFQEESNVVFAVEPSPVDAPADVRIGGALDLEMQRIVSPEPS